MAKTNKQKEKTFIDRHPFISLLCPPIGIIGEIHDSGKKSKKKKDDLSWIDRIEEFDAFMN